MNLPNFAKFYLSGLTLAGLLGLYYGFRNNNRSINFFPIAALDQSAIPKDLFLAINHANEDMNLLLEGELPIHARDGKKLLDGGSVCYENSEYQLWDFRKLTGVNGTMFVKRGVSVFFKQRGSSQNFLLDHASYTWLEGINQPTPSSP